MILQVIPKQQVNQLAHDVLASLAKKKQKKGSLDLEPKALPALQVACEEEKKPCTSLRLAISFACIAALKRCKWTDDSCVQHIVCR